MDVYDASKVLIFDIEDEDIVCDYCENTATRHVHIPPSFTIMVCSHHYDNTSKSMPANIIQDMVPVCSAHTNDAELLSLQQDEYCEYCHEIAEYRILI